MGYYSNAMIGLSVLREEESYPSQWETLQYFREDLEAKLEELNEIRPHDAMDPEYDRYFYSEGTIHYYENPSTVQDILFALREIAEQMAALGKPQSLPTPGSIPRSIVA